VLLSPEVHHNGAFRGEVMNNRVQRSFIRGAVALATIAGTATGLVALSATATSAQAAHVTGHVLTVGTYNGHVGQYSSVQAAVNAAQPGDWILVAPGDYKERADLTNTPSESQYGAGSFGGVLVTTSGIHIRGMSRNTTIIDGTKVGAPACSTAAGDQQVGPTVNGRVAGRNGINVYAANNVSVDNLTICNYLSGNWGGGNQIWWNGKENANAIGLSGYEGSYLTATTTYFGGNNTAGTYGIFSSNASNGSWSYDYASNMNDSGFYIGACRQLCSATVNKVWAEGNALGYSGTNSGGALVIENSLFDNNTDGFDTNTQVAGDPPPPQNGACPNNGISPITHTHSCWVLRNNTFTNNNNANAPRAGTAAAGPPGTGMTLSGGINDTVMNNTFTNNNAWGLLVVPYPDSDTPPTPTACADAGGFQVQGLGCVFDPKNDTITGNKFSKNGSLGNPSNGDLGELTLNPHASNCFSKNVTPDGMFPTGIARELKCTGTHPGNAVGPGLPLYLQAICDTGFGSCPSGANYPKHTGTVLQPLPASSKLATMPNPCVGVPNSAWCVNGRAVQ